MILNQSNTNFTKEGALSEEALLTSKTTIIYKSNSLITSKSYSGKATKITKLNKFRLEDVNELLEHHEW